MTTPALELSGVVPRDAADLWGAPLSFRVERGTFATLVTTPSQAAALMRLVLALDTPAQGSIRVLGEEPHRMGREPLRRFRRRVGSCLLPDGLMANITLRANVALPLVFGDGCSNREAEERAEDILSRFGLARWADHRPSDLAPDTRQVASLARAVSARPELLVLHDPLTSVSNAEAVNLLATCHVYATTVVAAVHGEDEAVCLMADSAVVWDTTGCREIARP
jgi:ABC-type ATPase involved in cell division